MCGDSLLLVLWPLTERVDMVRIPERKRSKEKLNCPVISRDINTAVHIISISPFSRTSLIRTQINRGRSAIIEVCSRTILESSDFSALAEISLIRCTLRPYCGRYSGFYCISEQPQFRQFSTLAWCSFKCVQLIQTHWE